MDIKHTADQVIANTYARYPLALVRGEGSTVYDDQGRAYLDLIAGIAVCNLGHSHPRLAAVLAEQARVLWHVSNLFYTGPQAELAQWLTDHSFADRVFFANSGAEANEAAIKLARKYFKDKGEPHRFRVVSMQQSFHGRTMATLSATGQDKVRKGFDPTLEGFDFVPFNDICALRAAVGTMLPVLVRRIPVARNASERRPASDDSVVSPGQKGIARRPGIGKIERRPGNQRLETLVGGKAPHPFEGRNVAL